MTRLKRPQNQNAAILWLFLRKPTWNRWKLEEWTGSSYPPARIADLRKSGLLFSDCFRTKTNRFGHTYHFREWTLTSPKEQAIETYNKINGTD